MDDVDTTASRTAKEPSTRAFCVGCWSGSGKGDSVLHAAELGVGLL